MSPSEFVRQAIRCTPLTAADAVAVLRASGIELKRTDRFGSVLGNGYFSAAGIHREIARSSERIPRRMREQARRDMRSCARSGLIFTVADRLERALEFKEIAA